MAQPLKTKQALVRGFRKIGVWTAKVLFRFSSFSRKQPFVCRQKSSLFTTTFVRKRMESPIVRFGVIADVQYADHDNGYDFAQLKLRRFRNSVNVLSRAVAWWNTQVLDRPSSLRLGDFILSQRARKLCSLLLPFLLHCTVFKMHNEQ